jgi:hypothetical protein
MEKIFIILMPADFSSENLFVEFDDILEECCSNIYDEDLNFKDNVPVKLSRAVSALRNKEKPTTLTAAKKLIKNEQDVKDIFWAKVEESNYQVDESQRDTLYALLGLQQ